MDWDRVEGNWKQLKGKAKERWGKLTDDDLERAKGRQEQIEWRLQALYGMTRDEAKKQVREFSDSL